MSQPKRIRRKDLKEGEVLCAYCTARCCRYFALPIEEPHTWEDYDHIRWYMMHGQVAIFVDDGVWYLMVMADCKHLQEDHRCGHYDHRPQICRSYSTDNCEYDDDAVYDKFFETPEQLWEYAHAALPNRNPRRFSPAPPEPREVTLPMAVAVR
ncbi:MAG: YkgJ family cysteine cluster protein [Planctomycetaceae bacterium]|nr:YkgJ family cysteine cluster protein [Planctomycetaceae bacterium]